MIGVLALIFKVILAVLPGVGRLSLVWIVGAHTIAFGIAPIVLALRVRGGRRDSGDRTARRRTAAPFARGFGLAAMSCRYLCAGFSVSEGPSSMAALTSAPSSTDIAET